MLRDFSAWIADLTGSPGPITFLDAWELIREARRQGEPSPGVLSGLILAHDAPGATIGAQEVLGEFLRGWAQRFSQERALAARPLDLGDHDATLRAPLGHRALLKLVERRGLGLTWEVDDTSEGLALERLQEDGAHAGFALFELRLNALGRGTVSLEERQTVRARPGQKPRPQSGLRKFRLSIVVEQAQ